MKTKTLVLPISLLLIAFLFLSGCGTGKATKIACVPTTCAEQGRVCGSMDDGCAATLECGTCEAGKSCDVKGSCVCDVLSVDNGVVDSTTCAITCNVGYYFNNGVCGTTCTPKTKLEACGTKVCGVIKVDNGCGVLTDYKCGVCILPQLCATETATTAVSGTCCTPLSKTAACGEKKCGNVDNGCGGTIVCGVCTTDQKCSNGACI